MNTFSKMWGIRTPEEAKAIIEKQRMSIQGEPKNLEEQAIRLVGNDIYEKLVKVTQRNNGEEAVKTFQVLLFVVFQYVILMTITILMIVIRVFQSEDIMY